MTNVNSTHKIIEKNEWKKSALESWADLKKLMSVELVAVYSNCFKLLKKLLYRGGLWDPRIKVEMVSASHNQLTY